MKQEKRGGKKIRFEEEKRPRLKSSTTEMPDDWNLLSIPSQRLALRCERPRISSQSIKQQLIMLGYLDNNSLVRVLKCYEENSLSAAIRVCVFVCVARAKQARGIDDM